MSSTATQDLEKDGTSSDSNTPLMVLKDWDGQDDPGNPKNWSFGTKVYATAVPALFAFVVTFGTSVYSAGLEQVMEQFNTSQTVAILGISFYSVGIGFGPMIGAPISEAFGRKAVYLITMPISILFMMGSGLAENTRTLLVCRFLSSTFGAPAVAVGAGTLSDIWELHHGGGLASMLFILSPFIGSSLGPLVGGYTMETRGDWRWLMWVMILFAGPIWIMSFFFGETSKKELLRRRAHERGLPAQPKPPAMAALKMLLVITLFRPIRMLFVEPIVISISIYISFAFGVLFAIFVAYPYVLGSVYGFSLGQTGLAFIAIIIGIILAGVTFAILDRTLYAKAKAKAPPGKMPPPEERLYTSMLGSLGIPVRLKAGIPFGWGITCIFLGTMTYLIDTYQALNAASAVAANGLLRYTFGAVFPLFTIPMYSKLGIGWAGSLLGFISLLLLPIPWVLYKWGPYLRSKSSYETGHF
ncbi:hypothetical protein MMC27_000590 [Xylographa pallens]|nr:hypothetical protein [Xylographa pallens]